MKRKWSVSRLIAATASLLVACTAPAWAQGVPECAGLLPASAKLPDLVNIIPHHLHVQEANQRHRLMFTTGFGNTGFGPMELAPSVSLTDPHVLVAANQNIYPERTNAAGAPLCQRSLADAFIFHPEHNHWHLVGINGFAVHPALDSGSGGVWDVTRSIGAKKESFCLLDYINMSDEQLASFGLQLPAREYFDCFGVHGVSIGWVDVYHHATHDQFVDITGTAAGIYYLVLNANPDKIFLEHDYTNNRAWVSFRLEYNNTNNAIATVLATSVDRGEGMLPPSKTNR